MSYAQEAVRLALDALRDVKIVANSGALDAFKGEPWLRRVDEAFDALCRPPEPQTDAFPIEVNALRELVALKDLKDEESRLRQRRIVAIERDVAETERVDAMRDDYNHRITKAWQTARIVVARRTTS